MNFFDQVGKMAIGSRLRFLTEQITADAEQIYVLFGVALQPKWFPVFYVLTQHESAAITEIAKEIGHSHVSVSKIVREMIKKGLIKEQKDNADGRKTVVSLTPEGREVATRLQDQLRDVDTAIEELQSQTQHDLWRAIGEWEYLLGQKSLLRRVQEQKKLRESSGVQIVDYKPEYNAAFRALNEEWISTYFKMEAADYKALDDPEGYILAKGGHILVALLDGKPMGVCALIKMDDPDYQYELAKMAVSPEARGKNLGWLLGSAIANKARELGARAIYLESNTILKPAISLYEKLGFRKVGGRPTPYERANIQMELVL
ncbi:helix-turn-helix domain-containing GNAT family N-acetyltransferase [Chitinophaga sp. Cy-1792]|uniref:bifunctional helix-turn-helix transcriptional regulator/GNAT family N-acetyltransferase n=1 Tax=Chitinophaga sp. Cy-1792 TaxID=2608339 RepID=UPI001421D9C0|nr:helix-turn-helix domain-containing GNAT family N-acetyltransferase [Chitinophaga sp. Cy-1792]NIG56385.1 MarR family transcriptional regulator [Chitinophaga sp. Cy-1792]